MERVKCIEAARKNMLLCGDLLWISISVTSIKQLIGGFSSGWFLIVVIKCFSFCDRRAKEFKVSRPLNIFVLFLIEKSVVQVS